MRQKTKTVVCLLCDSGFKQSSLIIKVSKCVVAAVVRFAGSLSAPQEAGEDCDRFWVGCEVVAS